MYLAVTGRMMRRLSLVRMVKATNNGRPVAVLPTAIKRPSPAECLGSGATRGFVREQGLNLRQRNAVLLALCPVAFVPIEAANPQVHVSTTLYKCVYVCQTLRTGSSCGSSTSTYMTRVR
jgi:hypothetical protein